MERLFAAAALGALCAGAAHAENIGISIQNTNELLARRSRRRSTSPSSSSPQPTSATS